MAGATTGRHWQVEDALFRPRPSARPHADPHLILGGEGGPRLARLVATYADEFNRNSAAPAKAPEAYDADRGRLRGRPGATRTRVVRSRDGRGAVAETDAEFRDASAPAAGVDRRRGRRQTRGSPSGRPLDHGHPGQARERIDAFAAAGVQRIMFQDFLPRDLDMVRLLGRRESDPAG